MKLVWQQFLRFGVIGISSATINLGLYYILIYLGVDYLLANFSGWVCSVSNTFFWNRRSVFPSSQKWTFCLLKTYITYANALIISTLLLGIFVHILGWSEIIAPIIIMGIMTPFNFLINKYWVF